MPSPMGESTVECGSLSSMLTVSFTIGDKVFDLYPKSIFSRWMKVLKLSASVALLLWMFLLLVDPSGNFSNGQIIIFLISIFVRCFHGPLPHRVRFR
ncbi:hypothetical protein E1A91_A09G053800v1 [Gossypium mustelinum]|nr:hypothetical protein E1A91_A09G053800v1 [Gossypium mustelinum]